MITVPFEEIINCIAGQIPTFDFFDTNPPNPERMTDENFDTESGEGVKSLSVPGTVGMIIFDLGAIRPVLVVAVISAHRDSGDGTLWIYVDQSDDNIAWQWGAASILSGVSEDRYRMTLATAVYARYFRIRVYSSGTSVPSVYHVKLKQVMALRL